MPDQMTQEQRDAVGRARRALAFIAHAWPDQARALVATTCAIELVELLQGPIAPSLVETINTQLQGTPYVLTRRQAN